VGAHKGRPTDPDRKSEMIRVMKKKGFSMTEVLVVTIAITGIGMALGSLLGDFTRGVLRSEAKLTINEQRISLGASNTQEMLRFVDSNRSNPFVDSCIGGSRKLSSDDGAYCKQHSDSLKLKDSNRRALISNFIGASGVQDIYSTEIYDRFGTPIAGSDRQPLTLNTKGQVCAATRAVPRVVDGKAVMQNYVGIHAQQGTTDPNTSQVPCPLRSVGYLVSTANLDWVFVVVSEASPNLGPSPASTLAPALVKLRIPADLISGTSIECAVGTALVGFNPDGSMKCRAAEPVLAAPVIWQEKISFAIHRPGNAEHVIGRNGALARTVAQTNIPPEVWKAMKARNINPKTGQEYPATVRARVRSATCNFNHWKDSRNTFDYFSIACEAYVHDHPADSSYGQISVVVYTEYAGKDCFGCTTAGPVMSWLNVVVSSW
jgi:hypothetical protein